MSKVMAYLHQRQYGLQYGRCEFFHLLPKTPQSPGNLIVDSKGEKTETTDAESTFTLQQQQYLGSLVLVNVAKKT